MMNPSDGGARGKWMALTAALLGWLFDGLEMGLFPLAGRPALMELMSKGGVPAAEKDVAFWFGIIIAIFLLGAAAGGVLFGWLGDRIGRVKAMTWSVAFYSVFSGLGAFITEPWHMGALRFFASLGMGGEWALGVALVMEKFPSTSRPLMAGLIGAAANVGYMLVALISMGLQSFTGAFREPMAAALPTPWVDALFANGAWRMLFLIGALPAVLTFVIRLMVPESEKWQEAAKAGKPRVAEIFDPKIRRMTLTGACLAGLALLGTWGSVQWIPSWTHQFTNKQHLAREWAQFWMSTGATIFTIVAALMAQRFNRRGTYVALCLLSLAVCQIFFRWQPAYGNTFLFMTFLAGGLTASFYGWLPLYLPELFPTRVRATGSGFCFNIGRVFAAGGNLLSGWLVAVFGGYPQMCATISLIYVVGFVLVPLCPETKDKPLPE